MAPARARMQGRPTRSLPPRRTSISPLRRRRYPSIPHLCCAATCSQPMLQTFGPCAARQLARSQFQWYSSYSGGRSRPWANHIVEAARAMTTTIMSSAHNNAYLHRPRGDVHATRTFTARETMPLLTDMDPSVNNNEWAAGKVNPPPSLRKRRRPSLKRTEIRSVALATTTVRSSARCGAALARRLQNKNKK